MATAGRDRRDAGPRERCRLVPRARDVAYSLREPEVYTDDRIVVVGGGDSAVEAALALAGQPGNAVRLSYRGERLARIKPKNHERIEEAAASGRVELLLATNVAAIGNDHVVYRETSGEDRRLDNDRVFVFIGGELPTRFLKDCGVDVVTKFGTV